jgi:hypothetical protein
MKMTLIILLFNLIALSTSAQESNVYRKDFNEQGIALIIEKESRGKVQYLKILDTQNDKLIKTIRIDNEYDLCKVGASFFGDRKFAIINGRYRFYIVNLSTNILIGPFSGTVRGEIEDATSLVLGYFNIFNDGQYLTFASYDFGVCCYNLIDLYNPIEIEMFTGQKHSKKMSYNLDLKVRITTFAEC